MSRSRVGWVAFWAGFAALDLWAAHRGASLSRTTRDLFHTHTTTGRACFTAALTLGGLALWRHICKGAAGSV